MKLVVLNTPSKIILLFFVSFIIGCKYEDGPAISFRSASSRVQGTYDIKKFEYGGADSTFAIKSKSCYGEIKIEVAAEGISMNRGTNCPTSGSWDLNHNNEKINIRFTGNFEGIPPWGNGYTMNYDIIMLKDKEMTFTTEFNGKHIKIELYE